MKAIRRYACFILALLLISCQSTQISVSPSETAAIPSSTPTLDPTATATATPQPTLTPTQRPTATSSPTAAPTEIAYDFSKLPGWLAYVDFDCNGLCTNISIIRPDVTDRQLITDHDHGMVNKVAWAPDGRSIAFSFFTLGEDGHDQLRLVSIKNKQETVLTDLPAQTSLTGFTWSKDGRFITYTSEENGSEITKISRVNVQSHSVIHFNEKSAWSDSTPDWSPDGKRIAITSDRPGGGQSLRKIWVMGIDGTNPTELAPEDGHTEWEAFWPRWSPDGKQIAFFRMTGKQGIAGSNGTIEPVSYHKDSFAVQNEKTSQKSGLWVMDADGSHPTQLVDCESPYGEPPIWSPDGEYLAFSCGAETKSTIIVYSFSRQDGFGITPAQYYSISWSPDGQALIYLDKTGEMQRSINILVLSGDSPFHAGGETAIENPVWSPVDRLP